MKKKSKQKIQSKKSKNPTHLCLQFRLGWIYFSASPDVLSTNFCPGLLWSTDTNIHSIWSNCWYKYTLIQIYTQIASLAGSISLLLPMFCRPTFVKKSEEEKSKKKIQKSTSSLSAAQCLKSLSWLDLFLCFSRCFVGQLLPGAPLKHWYTQPISIKMTQPCLLFVFTFERQLQQQQQQQKNIEGEYLLPVLFHHVSS